MLLVLRTHNNTDGNKLVIALYYGDNNILMHSKMSMNIIILVSDLLYMVMIREQKLRKRLVEMVIPSFQCSV